MSHSKKDIEKQEKGIDGMVMQIVLSVISLLLGVLLLFVPEIQLRTLSYVFCGAVIAAGVAAIVSFFLSEAYKRLHNYNFALGVMLLILGCSGLLRVDELTSSFTFFMGAAVLVLGIAILQTAVQLKVLDSSLWIVELILTIITLLGSIFILADVRAVLDMIDGFTYWVLVISGALSIFSLLFAWIGIRQHDKKDGKEQPEEMNDSME